jgi:hypothetical protein
MSQADTTKTEPCLWIRDLEDVVSEHGRQTVDYIRATCQCQECKQMREAKDDPL